MQLTPPPPPPPTPTPTSIRTRCGRVVKSRHIWSYPSNQVCLHPPRDFSHSNLRVQVRDQRIDRNFAVGWRGINAQFPRESPAPPMSTPVPPLPTHGTRAVKLGNIFLIFGPMWLKNPGQLTSSPSRSNSSATDLAPEPVRIPDGSGFIDDPHSRTHHQGWPRAKLPARNYASVRRSIRSSIWGRSHRANNRADRHALSEHVFLMRMLWIEGFTSHTTCSNPGRNRVDRDFLFDRVVITTARSDARAVFGHAVSLRVRCGCCASRLVRL